MSNAPETPDRLSWEYLLALIANGVPPVDGRTGPYQGWFHAASDPELEAALWPGKRIGNMCTLHLYGYGLYVLADYSGYVCACPQCLEENLRGLRKKRGGLSPTMEWLEGEAARERVSQDERKRQELKVGWEDLGKCARCRRMLPRKEVVYWLPPGVNESLEYCRPCHGALSREYLEAQARTEGAT